MMLSGPAAVMTPYTPCFLVLVLLIIIMTVMVVLKRRGVEEQSPNLSKELSDLVML